MTASHEAQFSTRPFVAGTLTGIRAYRVEPDGVLTGIHFQQEVSPEENLADCATAGARHALNRALSKALRQPEPEDRHELVSLTCQCGFYGYFDGSSDYMTNGWDMGPRVEAIVEAYGRVVVGSRGFRAEKLRLVALIHADGTKPPVRRRDRAADYLGVRPGLTAALVVAACLGGIGTAVLAATHSWLWFPLEVALFAVGTRVHRLYLLGRRRHLERRIALLYGRKPAPTAADWDRIKRAYPDVPVYTSRKAALAAHPLTIPDES